MELPFALLPTPINGPVAPGRPDPVPNGPVVKGALVCPAAPVESVEPACPVVAPRPVVAPGAVAPKDDGAPKDDVVPLDAVGVPPIPGDCIPATDPSPVLAMPASGFPKNAFTVVLFCPTGTRR